MKFATESCETMEALIHGGILVAHESRANDEAIQKLAKVLTTDDVKAFIKKQYEGAVVPAF
jgi:D-methionine transport system substrate-binding protein